MEKIRQKKYNKPTIANFEEFKRIVESINEGNLIAKVRLLYDRDNKYLTIQETEWLLNKYQNDLTNGILPEHSLYRTIFLMYMRKVIDATAKNFKNYPNYDYDILSSLGMECVVNCVDHYDQDKVVTIYKYIYISMQNKFMEYFKKQEKNVNLFDGKTVSIEERFSSKENETSFDTILRTREEKVDRIKKEESILLIDSLAHLPPYYQYITMKYYGYYGEATPLLPLARSLGRSHETIRQRLMKALKILQFVAGAQMEPGASVPIRHYKNKHYHVLSENEFYTIDSSKTLIELLENDILPKYKYKIVER